MIERGDSRINIRISKLTAFKAEDNIGLSCDGYLKAKRKDKEKEENFA